MKRNYILLLSTILFYGSMMAQETQKNFINYQSVARNAADQLMANESMTIGIALKMGSPSGAATYAENHSVVTDANGVFSIKIGSGAAVSGDYETISWGNEATFITVLVNGSEIGTTEMMAVPYALSSGDGTQQADEVPYDNTVSGLTAINAQQAIDELVGSGVIDADADPTNELQDISLTGTDLTISEGSTIDLSAIIPPGGTDDQSAVEVPFDNIASGLTATDTQGAIDELATSGLVDTDNQDLSLSGTTLQITDGTGVDLSPIIPPGGTDDQNAAEVPFDNTVSGLAASDTQAAIDELATSGLVDTDNQGLVLTGDILSIEDGIGSIDLSTYLEDDDADPNNEIDVTSQTGILLGDGTDVTGLLGTADGQVAKWDAATTSWLAGTDETGAGGSSPWTVVGSSIFYNNGSVGIGTTAPTSPLQIVTQRATALRIESTEGNGDGWIGFENSNGRIGYAGMFNGSRNVEFGTSGDNPTGKVHLTINADPELTVAADGNVGIGITNPETKLHVAGGARIDGSMNVDGALFVQTNSGGVFQLGSRGGGDRWSLRTTSNNGSLDFVSRTSNAGITSQRVNFIMQHSGEFKIGGIVENDAWLHVRKNSRVGKPHLKLEELGDDFARLELTNSASRFWHLAGYVGNNTSQDRFNIYNSAVGNILSVRGNGDVVINGSVAHSSDRRLKRDVVALPYGLETIMQLSPKAYYWKKDEENEQKSLGLIAQDVQPIIKEVVHGGGEDDDMLSISYTELVPVLIKAMQEQQEVIQQLRKEQKNTLNEVSLIKEQWNEILSQFGKNEITLKQ